MKARDVVKGWPRSRSTLPEVRYCNVTTLYEPLFRLKHKLYGLGVRYTLQDVMKIVNSAEECVREIRAREAEIVASSRYDRQQQQMVNDWRLKVFWDDLWSKYEPSEYTESSLDKLRLIAVTIGENE